MLAPPERVDIYQIGTLVCRLVCGRSIRTYLSSPGLLSTIPLSVRMVIDGCIGYDETSRINTATELSSLLDAIAAQSNGDTTIDSTLPVVAALRDTAAMNSTETDCAQQSPLSMLGQFELLEQIGSGGMGTVYRALDTSLNRVVAVKVLSERLARDGEFVQQFKAEASAAARLTHECIVPIYFIGEDHHRHFYAMRCVDGESLADRLHRHSPLPLDEALQIIEQTLTGLAAAHRQGLVHRDIKPGNILIDGEHGRAMLTDFGLARSLLPVSIDVHVDPVPDFVMGTAEYMAPEQARGDAVDPRSDLYSIGAVLYQLLSGTTPFHADTPTGHLMQHVCENPKPLGEVAPGLPEGLSDIVTRLLQKQPDARYLSVEELLIDLKPFLATTASDSRRPTTDPRTSSADAQLQRRASRPQRRAVVRLVLSLVAAVILGGALWNVNLRQAASHVRLAEHRDAVTALCFSPDGQFVVSGGGASSSLKQAGDTSLRLWDAASGMMRHESPSLPVRPQQLVFLPESHRVVAFGSTREATGTASVWEPMTGRLGAARFDDPFRFHFAAAAIRSDFIIAAGHDGITELQIEGDTISVTRRIAVPGDGPVRALAICRDRSDPLLLFATRSGAEHVILLVDLTSMRTIGRLAGFGGPIIALAASADGSVIATRSTEPVDSLQPETTSADFISVWDSNSHERRYRSGPFAPATPVLQLTSDGQRLLTVGESVVASDVGTAQAIVVIDTTTGAEVCRYETGSRFLTAVAIAPDNRRAAFADAEGRVVMCDLP